MPAKAMPSTFFRSMQAPRDLSRPLAHPHRGNADCLDAVLPGQVLGQVEGSEVDAREGFCGSVSLSVSSSLTSCELYPASLTPERLSPFKMRNTKLRHIFLAFAKVLSVFPRRVRSQSACLSLRPPIRQVVYEQIVSINTDVLFNTTFHPLPQAAITVTNAPTSYNGITTLQWTSTLSLDPISAISHSVTHLTAPSPSPTPSEDTFVLVAMRHSNNQKRQSGSYFVSSDGTITNDCTTAPIYTARNGVLTASVNGVVYTYSTSAGVGYAPFVPSTIPGSITTSFTIGANALLQWQNPAFFNGQASFCALQNGTVYAVFAQDAQPQGCLFISLSLFEVSSCQAISLATITGPPGPQGPAGSPGPQGLQGIQGIQGSSGPTVNEKALTATTTNRV